MPNSQMQGKTYSVPENLRSFLGTAITYENLKTTKTRLTQAKKDGNMDEFNRKGGDAALKFIEETLKKDRDSIYGIKKIGMDTGRENQFIKTHDKDSSKNPTKVGGLPKLNKGSILRKIMTNKEVYNESLQEDLKKILYLIEYLNNNKKEKL